MNQEIKKKWVDALRSGEYQQGRGQLRNNSSFCCLGVLCDLHAKEMGWPWEEYRYLDAYNYLPAQVLGWAGINSDMGGFVTYQEEHRALTTLNDSLKLSFNEIADLIEAQL